MALSDAMGPGPKKSGPAPAIAIKVAPVEHAVDDAAAQMMKAFHAHDTAALADAFRLGVQACMDEYEANENGEE